jgi:hypothetical protein
VKIVHVHDSGCPARITVKGEGATIAVAVRYAAGRLFALPGRSLGHKRVNTHEHRWLWGVGDDVRTLVVRESRSGASGKGSKRQVQLRLTAHDADRLDSLADHRGLDRSALVVKLIDIEYAVRPPATAAILKGVP